MTSSPSSYQVAVVGGGPGGYVAALRAAQLGLRTVCLDKRPTLGGTCLNVGCIPSKTLLHTSELYQTLRHAQHLGLEIGQAQVDFAQMMHHKEEVIRNLTQGIQGLFKRHGIDFVEGKVAFADDHTLEVALPDGTSQRIKAEKIILATGSQSIALPFAPFDEHWIISSTGALWLPQVPAHLAVVGAGAIGVELASVYQRLGSQVTVLEALDHICPGQDKAIQQALLRSLEKQGLSIHLKSAVTAVKLETEGVNVHYQDGSGAEQSLAADHVLVSVGRRPVTQDLMLAAAGLEVDAKGFLLVDDHFRTTKAHIYAIGDLIAGPGLAHRASEEGVAVAQLIAGMPARVDYLAIPNVIYTSPEAASVGMTEERASALGRPLAIGTAHFRGNARARCSDTTEGFVKIVADEGTQRILGMHIFGPSASELIAIGALAIAWQADLAALADTPYAHPTLSETIKEAALTALKRPLHA